LEKPLDSANALGIVVPTLDAEATILTTLTTLLPAINAGCEVVVVDGGSRDDTLRSVDSLGLRHIFAPGSMYEAINAGCRLLRTPWLTWINADDLLYTDTLAARLEAAREADVVYGVVDFIDFAGRYQHSWRSARPEDLLHLYRAGYSPLLQQGTLFRRQVFEGVGGFATDLRLVGDADFWWRALDAGFRFRESGPPPVGAFRLHSGQLSHRFSAAMRAEHRGLAERRGVRPRWWSGIPRAVRFRGRNARNYLIRYLRQACLAGRPKLVGSYTAAGTP
jgi:glycosyltransferase involved in cell wall biosynthesis